MKIMFDILKTRFSKDTNTLHFFTIFDHTEKRVRNTEHRVFVEPQEDLFIICFLNIIKQVDSL